MAHRLGGPSRHGSSPISPAGFERYVREVAELIRAAAYDPERLGRLAASNGLEVEPESVPGLVERHGLVFGR